MKTSLEWIRALVPGLTVSPKEYCDRMTMFGQKVEFYTDFGKDLDKIVIGEIKSIEKHPDADHLVICQVDVGKESPIQIVTGAPNTSVGMKVPVVLDGGRVAGGHDGTKTEGGIKIKKGKLRGVESDGMMCSIEELGSSRDLFPDAPESGLYPLPADAPVGEDCVHYLGLDDVVVDYEITSNRVDCFALLGIAREAACAFNLPFKPDTVTETGTVGNVADDITVEIQNKELCSRYTAREVKDVHIAPSPEWMQRRLRSQGIRPINNIVDITNYVMVEYGQPMHSYDYDKIAGKKIVVRNAAAGEKFTTLDGQERTLDEKMLMICDGEKAVGIAGIMGGENSMITDGVKTVLFEAATFDGTNIRLSSKRLGMRTEASGIFEKGLDPNNAILAMNRACQLVEELGAGTVVKGVVDIYENPVKEKHIPFEPDKYNAFLGTDIPADTIKEYFEREELKVEGNDVTIPTFRQDLEEFADLAEEAARFYGYDRIPTTLPNGGAAMGGIAKKERVANLAREVARFSGFSEAMTFSFESPKVFDKLLLSADDPARKTVTISNPLGEDFSIMRTLAVNGILTSLATNYGRRNPDARLFEIAKIYLPKAVPVTEQPDEREQFTAAFYGEGDFYTMKGVAEEFLEQAGLKGKITCDPNSNIPYLHPGRQANIIYDGKVLGFLGEIHPTVAASYGIKDRAYYLDIDLPTVVSYASFDRKYEGIQNFPASSRDISMIVPTGITAGQIEEVFEKQGGKLLESYRLFDIYEGAQVGLGRKSMAYSLTFRAKDRSITDDDVNPIMEKIVNALGDLKVELRK